MCGFARWLLWGRRLIKRRRPSELRCVFRRPWLAAEALMRIHVGALNASRLHWRPMWSVSTAVVRHLRVYGYLGLEIFALASIILSRT
jgi:hypothetical protein